MNEILCIGSLLFILVMSIFSIADLFGAFDKEKLKKGKEDESVLQEL